MSNSERPYNPIISIIGDSFKKGEAPVESTIDLTKQSSDDLEVLSKTYPEAMLEIFWRTFNSSAE